MKKRVFLLGGNDLEMETIRQILKESDDIIIEDNHLSWGACLSSYKDILGKYPEEEYDIYGIELKNDLKSVPANYKEIDHHDNNEHKPSSLEQVCDIVKHKMTREDSLIAANDARYIPGMREMDASDDDINDIRTRDRLAQGVTEDEEKLAEMEFRANEAAIIESEFLYSIKTELKHFSPLVDRIFAIKDMPFRLLVYSETEFTLYGWEKDAVLQAIKTSDLVKEGNGSYTIPSDSIYSGGGKNGFIGGKLIKTDFMNKLEDICKEKTCISKHFFLFPFTCSGIDFKSFHDTTWQDSIYSNGTKIWKREHIDAKEGGEKNDLYNELNYFYPHLHNILYDTSNDSCVRHYEYNGLKEAQYQITVQIAEDEQKKYTLRVDSININYYSTGVGVLSIETSNWEYNQNDDILRINQFGRRLFHPFIPKKLEYAEAARSLLLDLNWNEHINLMNPDTTRPNQISGELIEFIRKTLPSKENEIKPILDDRMFVLSWFRSNEISFSDDESFSRLKKGAKNNSFWYRYIFVDTNNPTCQNTEMQATLTESATYARWQKWGTLYGISRYSFVMLTNYGCPDYLLKYFETEYVKMAELALVQRASILKYTRALQECTNTKVEFKNIDKLSDYYEEYLHFLNNYRFTNISAQDQAIELYEMLCDNIHIKEDSALLDQQFNEVQELMELREEKIANEKANSLNMLAALAVPISITSAIFGFFFHDNFGTEKICDFYIDPKMLITNPGNYFLYATIILTILFYYISRRKR